MLKVPENLIVIGIAGPLGSGKSFFAEKIFQAIGRLPDHPDIYKKPFAGPLKDIAGRMGWNGEKDAKGRRLLQLLGTECGRECIGPNVWVDLWQQEVRELCYFAARQGLSVVILADDVRFENEAQTILDLGGILYEMDPPMRRWIGHASERGLPRTMASEVNVIPNDFTEESVSVMREYAQDICDRVCREADMWRESSASR